MTKLNFTLQAKTPANSVIVYTKCDYITLLAHGVTLA